MKPFTCHRLAGACVIACMAMLTLGPVAKANLITNPSFESGTVDNTPIGWSVTADTGSGADPWVRFDTVRASDGDNYLQYRGNPTSGGADGSISQSFSTVLGQTYDLSFDYRADGGSAAGVSLHVTVADLDVNITDFILNTWKTYTGSFTGTGSTVTLIVQESSTNSNVRDPWVDNFNVDAAVSIPTPAALPAGFGLLAMLALRRRR